VRRQCRKVAASWHAEHILAQLSIADKAVKQMKQKKISTAKCAPKWLVIWDSFGITINGEKIGFNGRFRSCSAVIYGRQNENKAKNLLSA
jgi:hypothetical protein